ncbi:MAG TPA: Asp23/Gls24 family envelope stress response protein [Clostridia bacterium]|nr:Asp23/Gls24 family envelope stress response protein [Clostridia bacterium]
MEQNHYADAGTLKISEDVLATVAGMTAREIKGVASLSLRPGPEPRGFMKNRSLGKTIRLELKDGEAVIDIYVNLFIGFKIPDVASEIQDKVKESIQNMTGITVSKVNVHVSGVVIDQGAGGKQ